MSDKNKPWKLQSAWVKAESWKCQNTEIKKTATNARIQKVLSKGVQFWQRLIYLFIYLFILWGEGGSKYHYERTTIGLARRRWWRNIECWLGSCDFSGNPDLYCLKNLYFCDFSGLGVPDPLSPIWIRTCKQQTNMQCALKIDIFKCVWLTCSCDSRRQIL